MCMELDAVMPPALRLFFLYRRRLSAQPLRLGRHWERQRRTPISESETMTCNNAIITVPRVAFQRVL